MIVAVDDSDPIAGSVSDYLAEPNAGVIEFLVVHPESRRDGLGARVREETERTLADDACRNGQSIAWVTAEMDDPFRTARSPTDFDPFVRALIWHRWGYRMLDFPYVQPALSQERSPVHTLLLMTKTYAPAFSQSIRAHDVRTLLREYFRWCMRVPDPDSNSAYCAMSDYLAPSDNPVAMIGLDDYTGAKCPAPLRIHEVSGVHDPEVRAAIDVYTAIFTDPTTAMPPTEFLEAFNSGGMSGERGCRYHLWSIYRPGEKSCEGMASFFTMSSAGFGGYVGLMPPLRGSDRLRYLMTRIERQMIQDSPSPQGMYGECAGRLERDIFMRPDIGFRELDVPYTQPRGPRSTLADRPRHLLYKPFGRVYRQPDIAVPDFLDSMREIMTCVYGVDDPQSTGAYSRLEHYLAGLQTVPVKSDG